MNFETAGLKPNKKPERKVTEPNPEQLDIWFEALLLGASKINEGMEGYIAELDLSELEPKFRQHLLGEQAGEGSYALKMLKIYHAGKGKEEFEAQKAAHEALRKVPGTASVPKPYFYRDITITSPEVKESLARRFNFDKTIDHVEVFAMDKVDGDDLATHMFREVIRRDPEKFKRLQDKVDTMSFPDLLEKVGNALGYAKPGGKGKSTEEKAYEAQRVYDENASLLYQNLHEKDFTLSTEQRDKLAKSLKALHKAGIYHRDLHHRNIMLGKDGEVHIIDFGKSKQVEPGRTAVDVEDIYGADSEKSWLRDEEILNVFEEFSVSKRTLEHRAAQAQMKAVEATALQLQQRDPEAWQEWMKRVERFSSSFDTNTVDELVTNMPGASTEREAAKAVGLLEVAKRDRQAAEDYLDFIRQQMGKKRKGYFERQIPPSELNAYKKALEAFDRLKKDA